MAFGARSFDTFQLSRRCTVHVDSTQPPPSRNSFSHFLTDLEFHNHYGSDRSRSTRGAQTAATASRSKHINTMLITYDTQLTELHQSNEDSVYEQDILRDPGSVKPWLAYIEFKTHHGTILEQTYVMERACAQLPRSYKLWKLVRYNPRNGIRCLMLRPNII